MPSESRRTRVLLVDDHSIVTEGLQVMLEQSGEYEVVGLARDGEEAVRVAFELSPDVVVMDVLMPNKNGVEACREIMESAPDTRVIMLTASTEEDAVIEAFAAGAMGYLQKVSGMERLVAAIRDAAAGEMRMPADVVRRVFARIHGRARAGEGRGRTDAEGAGDTHVVLPGPVIHQDSAGPGNQAGDRSKRHPNHSEQAVPRLETGNRGLGSAERTAGWLADICSISQSWSSPACRRRSAAARAQEGGPGSICLTFDDLFSVAGYGVDRNRTRNVLRKSLRKGFCSMLPWV